MRTVTFQVQGVPQPKGSSKAFVPKSWAVAAVAAGTAPRAVVTSDNPAAKDWTQLVRVCAQGLRQEMFQGPVAVSMVFALPRPQSLPRRATFHLKKPDLDKLARCVLDGLSGVLFLDDRCVVVLKATKEYAVPPHPPGAAITVSSLVNDSLFT